MFTPEKNSLIKLPVSVVICAINESKRIKDAILSANRNNPEEVIVIEGDLAVLQ